MANIKAELNPYTMEEHIMRADFEAYLATRDVNGEPWTLARLLEAEAEAGIDLAVVMPNTQVDPDNVTLAKVIAGNEKCIGCALINPHYGQRAIEEVKRAVNEWGFRGIKLMAVVHKYSVDDEPLVRPVVETAAELGIIVSIHSGQQGCTANAIGAVAGWIPNTPVIMDHMGLPDGLPDAVAQAKQHPNLYLGTTILRFHKYWGDDPNTVVPAEVGEAIRALGANRIVFGSNLPEYRPLQVLNALRRLELGAEAERLIFGENLARIYGLARRG